MCIDECRQFKEFAMGISHNHEKRSSRNIKWLRILSFAFVYANGSITKPWWQWQTTRKKVHHWPQKKGLELLSLTHSWCKLRLWNNKTCTAIKIQIYLVFLSACLDSSKSRRVWLRRHKKCVLDCLVGCIVFRFPCWCAALIKYSSKNNIQEDDTFEWPLWYHCANQLQLQLWPLFLNQNDNRSNHLSDKTMTVLKLQWNTIYLCLNII